MSRHATAWITLAALTVGAASARTGTDGKDSAQEQKESSRNARFYCNVKALNAEERLAHKRLTERLVASRDRIVETERGFEFHYSPKSVSLAELADWVAKESKCCPFFDFHIDLEEQGNRLRLRLTGEEGIKPFILAEFAAQK